MARQCRDGYRREQILHAKNFHEKTSGEYYLRPTSGVRSEMEPFMDGDDDGILLFGVVNSERSLNTTRDVTQEKTGVVYVVQRLLPTATLAALQSIAPRFGRIVQESFKVGHTIRLIYARLVPCYWAGAFP